MTVRTWNIMADNRPTVEKVVARLNRRAARLGLTPLAVQWGDVTMVPHESGVGVDAWQTVTATGDTPRLNGWEFVATIQHAGEAGNILRTMPDWKGDIPTEYRTALPTCEHCKKFRRRNDTFLVASNGRYVQVGRNCMADFIGSDAVERIMGMAEMWVMLNYACEGATEYTGGGRGERRYRLSEVIAFAAQIVTKEGWVSRGRAESLGKAATADLTITAMDKARKDAAMLPSEDACALADRVLEWSETWLAKELARPQNSDYVWNMSVVLAGEYVTDRSLGLAVSILGAYQRETERAAATNDARATNTSAHVGVVGKRQVFPDLTVKAMRYIDGAYGTTTLVTYHDPNGNVIKWFASGYHDVKEGDTVTLTATVKAHGEYNGIADTTITRAKVK